MKKFAAIAILTVVAHYVLISESEKKNLRMALQISHQKERIDNDQIRDLMFSLREEKGNKQVDKAAGFVAGVLDQMNRPTYYDAIWHDGYNRANDVKEQILNLPKTIVDKK